MTHTSDEPITLIVTDIETDGHSPLRISSRFDKLSVRKCLGEGQ